MAASLLGLGPIANGPISGSPDDILPTGRQTFTNPVLRSSPWVAIRAQQEVRGTVIRQTHTQGPGKEIYDNPVLKKGYWYQQIIARSYGTVHRQTHVQGQGKRVYDNPVLRKAPWLSAVTSQWNIFAPVPAAPTPEVLSTYDNPVRAQWPWPAVLSQWSVEATVHLQTHTPLVQETQDLPVTAKAPWLAGVLSQSGVEATVHLQAAPVQSTYDNLPRTPWSTVPVNSQTAQESRVHLYVVPVQSVYDLPVRASWPWAAITSQSNLQFPIPSVDVPFVQSTFDNPVRASALWLAAVGSQWNIVATALLQPQPAADPFVQSVLLPPNLSLSPWAAITAQWNMVGTAIFQIPPDVPVVEDPGRSSDGAVGGGAGWRVRGGAKVNRSRIDDIVEAAVAKLAAERNPQAPPPSPKAILREIKAQEIPDLSVNLAQVKAALARLREELERIARENEDEEAAVMLLLSV